MMTSSFGTVLTVAGMFAVTALGPAAAALAPQAAEPIAIVASTADRAFAIGIDAGLTPLAVRGDRAVAVFAPSDVDIARLYASGAWLVLRAEPLGLCSPRLNPSSLQGQAP